MLKRFSVAMIIVGFALLVSLTFVLPSAVFATEASKSTSASLTVDYSSADNTIRTDVDSGKQYILIPSSNATSITATTITANEREATIDSVDRQKLYLEKGGNSGNNYYIKSYKVVYTLEQADKQTVSEVVFIDLDSEDATFVWETNSSQIIPAQVQRGSENSEVVFPYPFIYVGDEETAKNVDSVKKTPTDIDGLEVLLTGPDAQEIVVTKNAQGYYSFNATSEAKTGKYTVRYVYATSETTPVTKSFNFVVKNSEITQELSINEFSSTLPKSIALFVETEFPKAVVVNQNGTEVSVYTKIYLTFTPTSSEDSATIYTNDYDKKDAEGYTYTPSLNEFKFTPEVAGKYTARYVVTDFFGNTQETTSDLNAITSRKTAESGSGYIVEAYEDFDAEKTLIESGLYQSAEYMIPSRVNVANTTTLDDADLFNLPAFIGIDKQTTDSSKLTYERIVRYKNSSNTTVSIYFLNTGSDAKADGIYESGGNYKVEANKTIPFRFTTEADYTVEYIIRDASSNTIFDKTYTVKAESDFDRTDVKISVKFEGISNTTVKAGRVLKFKVEGTDVLQSDSSVADSRLQTNIIVDAPITYQIGANREVTINKNVYVFDGTDTLTRNNETYKIVDNQVIIDNVVYSFNSTAKTLTPNVLYADSEGFYTFDTQDLLNDDVVTIRAVLTDIYGNSTTTQNTRVITIQKINDITAPTAISDFDFDASWVDTDTLKDVVSGSTITLPSITFNDANNNISVQVTAKAGNTVVHQFAQNSGYATSITLGGEQFKASRNGDYTVTYSVTDIAGNRLVKSFAFTVNGPEKAIISLGSFDSSYEFGTEIDLKNLKITLQNDSGSEDVTDEYSLYTNISKDATSADVKAIAETLTNTILCQIIGDYELTDDESIIKAGQNGSVTINYWAVGDWSATDFDDNYTETAKSVTFTVSDTTKPTIIVNEGLIDEVVPYDKSATEADANRVKVVDVSKVWDLSGIQEGSLKISARYTSATKDLDIVKYDKDVEAELALMKQGYYGYFTATQNGTVTLTYSVTDNMGNTQTKTYTISVGDVSDPEISIATLKADVTSKTYNKDDTITLDLTKLTVSDDVSELTYSDVTVTVTCDGESVDLTRSDDKTTATFVSSSYGDYVITFSVKDNAGHSTSETISFSVKNSSSPSKNTSSTTIWGTILIIVILIALGVIIFLFAKPSKTKQTVKLEQKKEELDKKDKNDKIQV